MKSALILSLILVGTIGAFAWDGRSTNIDVIIDGNHAPKYYHQGTTYIEAFKDRKYSIRISNPLGERVAVALSVDGLNSIDAKHTDASQAAKWILGPYESIDISGWQVNDQQARQFFFTTEEKSYGARLGRTQNFGLISAVFFRERRPQAYRRIYPPPPPPPPIYPPYPRPLNSMGASGGSAGQVGGMGGMGGGSMDAQADKRASGSIATEESKSFRAPDSIRPSQPEYAATGIGNRVSHEVERVYLDLEDSPFATVELRYEFRSALIRLGVFPSSPPPPRDPLNRREKSRGFSDGEYCPEP
jgi:hypothetical protein